MTAEAGGLPDEQPGLATEYPVNRIFVHTGINRAAVERVNRCQHALVSRNDGRKIYRHGRS